MLALSLLACGDLLGLDDFDERETPETGLSNGAAQSTPSASSASGPGGAGGAVGVGGAGGATASTVSTADSSTTASSGSGGNQPLRVFVSATLYPPNVVDSVTQANQLCQVSADMESLGGTWHAWLSDFNLAAIDNITADGPWVTLDGQPVFDSKADMVDIDPLQNGIVLDEKLMDRSGQVVWTGTGGGGQAFHYCFNGGNSSNSWDVSGIDATFGLAGEVNAGWTQFGVSGCQSSGRLYCFEQ